MDKERLLREHICEIGRLMYEHDLVGGISGNISARLDDAHIVVTPSGFCKGLLTPEQLMIVDMAGQPVDAGQLKPTSELPMHLEAYRQRPDVQGVVHAHPQYAVALTIAGVSLQTYTLPETLLLMGEVPTTPFAMPSSEENRTAISALIVKHDAILLAYHGSLTVGQDVWMAYSRLETLEHTAKITYLVHQLGQGQPLPPDQLARLHQKRRDLGLSG